MPTLTHASNGINGGYDPTASAVIINALQTSMVTGALITAADVNALIGLWNTFNSHTHGVDDLYGIWDFGDGYGNPGYATSPGSSELTTTSAPNLSGDVATISQGDVVTAAKANELVTAFSGQLAHTHTWTDRTS